MDDEQQPDAQELPTDDIPEPEALDLAPTDTTESEQAPGDERQNDDTRREDRINNLEDEVRDLKEQSVLMLERLTELNQKEAKQEQDEIEQIHEKADLLNLIDQLQSQVDAAVNKIEPTTQDYGGTRFPVFLFKLTTTSGSTYDEAIVNGGAFAAMADSLRRQASADSLTSSLKNLAGDYGIGLECMDYNAGTLCKRVIRLGTGAMLFPVALTQTGGSAGSSSAYCSYTYTVKEISATVTLGTSIAPIFARAIKAECLTAAVKGLAYFHTDGTVKLLACDEVFKTKVC